MQTQSNKMAICLWFNKEALDAANYYTTIFKNSRIGRRAFYSKEGQEVHKKPEGSLMTVEFELEGQRFVALNGGPEFKFNEAVSLVVNCADQQEIDHYWNSLSKDADPIAQQCGWLKDKFGVSWQIVPGILKELVGQPGSKESDRAMAALLRMKKIELDALLKAYHGK
jgi:predicted 3-demethylubiquinone-9 3-methyltransferase (glyoxalase superfamily)